MVDLDTHKIIDIIDSRKTRIVEDWLRSYPNLKVVSRDGAHTYSSAVSNAHPNAILISDRFHLIKNLSDAVERYLHCLFPSRLVIPADTIAPEMEALYDTRNRAERIIFAQKKRDECYTANDIALLLHSSVTTIRNYLPIPQSEIPEVKENARERQHLQQLKNKKSAIEEVRKIYSEGHSIDEIMRLTKAQYNASIKKYLVLSQLYSLIREYHRIIFSQKSAELDTWIKQALSFQIDEVETYVNGLLSDIDEVKNAIKNKYNNGLAEGSVNKIKLTKRIMYGRNSFELLKARLLLNEIQIN